MPTLIRAVSAAALILLATGCTTPQGVAWQEYYFGADDAQREAELVCMRYPQHFPNCDVAQLRTLAEAIDLTGNNRCTDFTEHGTKMARQWGINNLSYVFIPGDSETGRDAHVALLVSTDDGKYVVDNGSVNSPLFYRTGSLEEFISAVDGDVMEIERAFTGTEALKYKVPVTALDAVLTSERKVPATQGNEQAYNFIR